MKSLPPTLRSFQTPNTKQAAALFTAGVPFFSSNAGDEIVANVYTEERPYADGMPGHVFYFLSPTGPDGVETEKLCESYDSPDFAPVAALDALVAEIAQTDPAMGERLRSAVLHATVSISRAALENRERFIDLWRNARPMIMVKRGEKALTLINRDSKKAREKWKV
jgi:hypothetical protein